MRSVLIVLVLAGSAWSQALTEVAGAVAGGSVGGVAGKKLSEGITGVLQKVDATTSKAAKTKASETPVQKAPVVKEAAVKDAVVKEAAPKPAGAGSAASAGSSGGEGAVLKIGPAGVVKDHSLVPPPPPIRRAAVVPPPPPLAPLPVLAMQPMPVLPPPPHATPEDLLALAIGTNRKDVLALGAPASRITMYDDGHLVEIFRYQTRETTFGVVRLSDGSVAKVEVR